MLARSSPSRFLTSAMSAPTGKTRRPPTWPCAEAPQPSNYRALENLNVWLQRRGIIALAGVDTRALAARIRAHGMPNGVIAHQPSGRFDVDQLKSEAKA